MSALAVSPATVDCVVDSSHHLGRMRMEAYRAPCQHKQYRQRQVAVLPDHRITSAE
ncbi:MAG: hypothetical protein V7731_19120 [Amphritea sp.]